MKLRLIDDRVWHRLWSVRVAIGGGLFWSAIGGLIMVWPALADKIPTIAYVLGGVVLSAAFGLARVLKQPGAE
ncbi:hypothetical protein A1D31_14260 [Bradyrhizobium liaoningense]|nr:hypothetical protein A1D31_14260 [Bradyrhizobium liaoningense]